MLVKLLGNYLMAYFHPRRDQVEQPRNPLDTTHQYFRDSFHSPQLPTHIESIACLC